MVLGEIIALMDANASVCIKNEETHMGIETTAYNVRNCLHTVSHVKANSRGGITFTVSANSFEIIARLLGYIK